MGACIPPSPQCVRTPKPSQVPICLLPMIHGLRVGTSSVSSPFVVAVNPEDGQYNPESVLLCYHKTREPPKCHKSRLLASHDMQATAMEQAAYSFHLPVRTPLPTPLQCVLPTPLCPISCSDVPSVSYSSQLSKHHRHSPLQSCPHSPLDSLSHSHQNTYPDNLPTATVVTPISTMA